MITINPQYLAGVIDSDGSFSITKRHVLRKIPNYTCMVQLTWNNNIYTQKFMKMLVSKYGGSFFIGMPSGKTNYPNTKEVIKYCATGAAAENMTNEILPYLLLKKKQGENIIRARTLAGSFRGKNRPENVTKELHQLYLLNKQLNSKNGVL